MSTENKKESTSPDLKVTDLPIYEALSKTYNKMKQLIGMYHPEVSEIHDKIAILFKEKTSKSGGKYVLAKVVKAPPTLSVLCKKEYIYIIYISDEAWGLMDEAQQEALIDRCLCSIKIKYDKKAEDVKYLIVKEDVVAYKAELSRHGYWWKEVEEKLEELHKKPDDDDDDEDDNQRMKSSGPPIDEVKVEDILSSIGDEETASSDESEEE